MGSSDDDNNLSSDLTKLYNMVFNKSTVLLIIWFLALHFVCYRLLKFFFSENLDTLDYQTKLSRMLDIAVFSFLLLFLLASYYSVPDKDKETMIETLADSFKNYANDKDSVYKTVVFLLLFYCAIYLFRIPMNLEAKPTFVSCTEFGAWTLFLIIVFVKFFNDVFGFSMIDIIYAFLNWSTLPESSGEDNSVYVADDDEDCEEEEEEPPSYLSKVLSYVTPSGVGKSEKKPTPESKSNTLSSIFNNLMTTLSADSVSRSTLGPSTNRISTGPPQTTLSSNISVNTSTTNSLQNNRSSTSAGTTDSPTTTLSSNVSANTSTTNSLQNNRSSTNTNTSTTDSPTTTLSSNISVNTSTTNSLENNISNTSTTGSPENSSTSTTSSSENNISNTSTTGSPENTTGSPENTSTTTTSSSGFRNMRESFDTMTPSSNNPEVFNVAGNFTYDDAQVVCAAYGATLANYDQIEDTYNNGGEWCNYGWSDGQHAYFPTQKSTWNKMQQNSEPESRRTCGRQGINGGYMPDKTKQMGINCYGVKPLPVNKDYELREQQQAVINAKTKQDVELESKIQYWKQQIDNGTISVNHYNQKVWSSFDTTMPPSKQPSMDSDQNNNVPNRITTLPPVISNQAVTTKGPPKMNNPNFNTTKK